MAFKTVQLLTMFPEFAFFEQNINLGNKNWTMQFNWRPRLKSWFVSIFDSQLQPLVQGRRLSPNTNVTFSRLDFPGKLLVTGDDSERRHLGRRLHVAYVELEE